MSNTGPIESYLKYNHSWKNDKMENSNISSNNSYSQNINEYKKIFDLSALNSENEAQYYGSGDQLNHPTDYSSNKKSKYYSPKKNNNEEWNKNISRTINKINQILDNDEPNSIYLDPNPIKRYNDNGDFEFNDPFMDHNNKIQINTTENKRENNKDPLRRRKSHSKKKSRKNSTKDPKKRDDLGTKSSSQKRKGSHSASSPKKKEKEKRKLSNNDEDILKNKNSNDTTNNKSLKSTESKYDADISLNSSLNSSDTSINKIIQKNLSEYSRDISDLINKDLENKLKNENNKKQESTKKHYDPVKKDEAHSKPLMNKNNKDNNDKNLSNQNVDNKNNVVKNKNNSELNNKIDYIDKLINEFKEKDDQQKEYDISPSFNINKFKSENVPIDNNKVKSSNEEISIEIKCPFYSNGCNWCNKQSKLSDHLLYECTFCPNIITNAFGKNNENKKKSIEDLNKKLSKLTIDNLKDDDKVELKKDIRSSEFDRDVLSVIFNNYLNEDDKPEKEKSIPDKQDGLFDQIIQNYKYTNDNNESHLFKGNNNNNNKTKDSNSNNIFNLTLDTNLFYNKEDLISTADINFNNEPLTWDINSEKDNTVPWSTTPISPSKKERKKYRLSDNNDKVSVKNKKSPDKEIYAQKRLLNKYNNLISSIDNPSSEYLNMNENEIRKLNIPYNNINNDNDDDDDDDDDDSASDVIINNNANTTKNNNINNNNFVAFNPNKPFKFEIPVDGKYYIPLAPPAPAEPLKHNISQELSEITSSINSQLNSKNKDIYYMFTPQEIEVLMDVWFKDEDSITPSEPNLIFSRSETNFIKNLLTSFDEETMHSLKEYKHHKMEESNHSLLNSIDNLLAIRKKYGGSTNSLASSSFNKLSINFSSDFMFDFNYDKWNKSRDNVYKPSITNDLNEAFTVQKENSKKPYSKLEIKKKQFKYMILCWIIKLFKKNTIYTICWKIINAIYNWIKYIKNKLFEKAIKSSKYIAEKEKNNKRSHNEEKITHKKDNISNYINKALSKYDSNNNLLMKWSPDRKKVNENDILKKKKKFNKSQAQYYRINQHDMKHNQDRHTLYTNFLDYQNVRGFKSLNVQNNIRKKIKMMQIINDLKNVKTSSMISPINKNKKRKVEMENKKRNSVVSYFNNTLNMFMNSLMNNSKSKSQIAEVVTAKKNIHIFGAEANIDFNKHTLIIYNKKYSELNYIPKNKDKVVKKAIKLDEIDQLIIYNNDESGWMNILMSRPISNNMDLFYYEVKVGMAKPSKKYLYSWSIGFSTSKVQLNKYPDRLYSWDFYNTGSINKNNVLEKYGETYSTNDIIGCGIDFRNNLAFFTKNGKFLGVAASNFLTEDLELYPNIGLFNYSKVETNFGSKKFIYNIDGYFYNKKNRN